MKRVNIKQLTWFYFDSNYLNNHKQHKIIQRNPVPNLTKKMSFHQKWKPRHRVGIVTLATSRVKRYIICRSECLHSRPTIFMPFSSATAVHEKMRSIFECTRLVAYKTIKLHTRTACNLYFGVNCRLIFINYISIVR